MKEDSPLSSNVYDMGAYSIAKFWQEKIVKEFATTNGGASRLEINMATGFLEKNF